MTTVTSGTPAATAREPRFRVNRKDTISTIATVVLTAIALLAGLALRNSVESRTKTYKDPSGVVINYPDTWHLNTSDAAQGVLSARDPNAQGFPTTLELRRVAVDPDAKDEDALALAANQVAINRGNELTAFKLFDITTGQPFKGLPGATTSFVFVSDTSGALQEGLPVVVLGDSVLVRKGGTVYVFSLLSTEDNRPQALASLRAFVDSVQLP
jgi:hypothetical protein